MQGIVHKVTAFITRESERGWDLLLLQHPDAGIQIPAGTVEENETPEEAAMREAREETGLGDLTVRQYLGYRSESVGPEERIIATPTKVYARPDDTSWDWSHLPRGHVVTILRRAEGYSQVRYTEQDRVPDPQYVTMEITGWVPDGVLADRKLRHFFHLHYQGQSEERWEQRERYLRWVVFWAPIGALPEIIWPQNEWLVVLHGGVTGLFDGPEGGSSPRNGE